MTRIHEVPGRGMYRVAAGKSDRFLHRHRIKWGDVFGWLVLLSSGAFWGLLAALFVRGRM